MPFPPAQEGEEPDAVVLEKMVATYAENPTQYLPAARLAAV